MDDLDGPKDLNTVGSTLHTVPADDASSFDHTHTKRVLNGRQVQMFAIGATIGTVVFVTIGNALMTGGPLFLLLGYAIWCSVIFW